MSTHMNHELLLFFSSCRLGIFLVLCYDLLRTFRRLFPHRGFAVALEDLLYWIWFGMTVFGKMYRENHGIIRSYAIIGILLGMTVYQCLCGRCMVQWMTKLLGIPVKFVLFLVKWLLFAIRRCNINLIRLLCRITGKPEGTWRSRWKMRNHSVEEKIKQKSENA